MTDGRRLEGRIALITGASRGIGAAVARRFAAEGARLILVARTSAGLEEVDDQIRAACGAQTAPTLVTLDLASPADIDDFAAALAQRFGRLDILVGNAGLLGTLTPMQQIEPRDWDEIIAVNLTVLEHNQPMGALHDPGVVSREDECHAPGAVQLAHHLEQEPQTPKVEP